jgi:hypothetical protein
MKVAYVKVARGAIVSVGSERLWLCSGETLKAMTGAGDASPLCKNGQGVYGGMSYLQPPGPALEIAMESGQNRVLAPGFAVMEAAWSAVR